MTFKKKAKLVIGLQFVGIIFCIFYILDLRVKYYNSKAEQIELKQKLETEIDKVLMLESRIKKDSIQRQSMISISEKARKEAERMIQSIKDQNN